MAVYTELEFDEIVTLVAPLGLGHLVAAQGIAAGVENTTYFLDFVEEQGRKTPSKYVLTIAETLAKEDLLFIARLMHDLSARGLPVPAPVFAGSAFTADHAVLTVRDKSALLVARIAGEHPQTPTPALCDHLGRILAEMHLVTLSLGYKHASHRSLDWVGTTGQALLPLLEKAEGELLKVELKLLEEFVSANTRRPQAVIHGDLFRDNVLVKGGAITALIDFFSAGTGYLLLDLAIVVNDWCFDERGHIDLDNYNALTRAYCRVRQPGADEAVTWSQLLRIAALRFWVSRLNEQLLPSSHAPRGRGKNPALYRHRLLLHRDSPLPLPLPQ